MLSRPNIARPVPQVSHPVLGEARSRAVQPHLGGGPARRHTRQQRGAVVFVRDREIRGALSIVLGDSATEKADVLSRVGRVLADRHLRHGQEQPTGPRGGPHLLRGCLGRAEDPAAPLGHDERLVRAGDRVKEFNMLNLSLI